MIESKQHFNKGRFEIRCKLPKTIGFWPAFWLYGSGNNTYHELDCFEALSWKPSKISNNVHDLNNSAIKWYETGTDLTSNFHKYAFEWDDTEMRWYLDGVLLRELPRLYNGIGQEISSCNVPFAYYTQTSFYPTDDFFLPVVANVAIPSTEKDTISHSFTGHPESSTLFPNQMEIDYIRVYQRVPQAGLTDLCKPTISGASIICANTSYTYTANTAFTTNITWTVSSNLQIINTINNTLTVNKKAGTLDGNAWIKASSTGTAACANSENTLNIWVGKPNITVNKFGKSCCIRLQAKVGNSTFSGWQIDGETFTATNIMVCQTNLGVGVYQWGDSVDQLETLEPNGTADNGYPTFYSASATNECGTTTVTGTALLCEQLGWKSNIAPNPCNNSFTLTLDPQLNLLLIKKAYLKNIVTNQISYYKIDSHTQQIETANLSKGYYLFVIELETDYIVNTVKVEHD